MIQEYNDVSTEDSVADCVLVKIVTCVGVMLSSLLINFASPPTDKELLCRTPFIISFENQYML